MSSQTGGEDDLLLERQLCFALAVASRTVTSAYRPVLQDLNLTHPQYLVMLALWEKSPRSVKEIGDALLLSAATLSPLLKRLEAAGYVTRRRTEGDERTLAVGLTEQGACLREAAKTVPGTMMQRLSLTRAEAAELHSNMMHLIGAVQGTPPLL
jgi:DNA-binding MarR family transcriptional regulator